MFVRLAALRGARVIASDLSPARLTAARALGASETICVRDVDDQVAAVRALTPGGRGVDAAIEAVGITGGLGENGADGSPWRDREPFRRREGRFGVQREHDAAALQRADDQGRVPSHPAVRRNRASLLASGMVPADAFITGERPLVDVIDALEAMGRGEVIKYAIVPPAISNAA